MALAEFRRAKVAGRELMPTDDDEEGGACSPGGTKAATEAAEKRAQRAAPRIFMMGACWCIPCLIYYSIEICVSFGSWIFDGFRILRLESVLSFVQPSSVSISSGGLVPVLFRWQTTSKPTTQVVESVSNTRTIACFYFFGIVIVIEMIRCIGILSSLPSNNIQSVSVRHYLDLPSAARERW